MKKNNQNPEITTFLEIDVRVLTMPKKQQAIEAVRNELNRLWKENEDQAENSTTTGA